MTEQATATANAAVERLKAEARDLLNAFGERAVSSLREKVEETTGRLTDITSGEGGPGIKAALSGVQGLTEGKSPGRSMFGAGLTATKEKIKGMFGKGGGGGDGGKKLKVTNIIESIDVGVPISLAYNQWTQFTDFPSFMKKVESVEQAEDDKLNWKAQVLWSHRTWESTILEQQPEDKIVWQSKGAKGYVNGAVTFHEIAPNLTRILVVLEYYPQGFFERTGNIWRAPGRRARLELKHFRRHIMTDAILHPDEIEGWRGQISDGEVTGPDGETHPASDSQQDGEGQEEQGEDQQGQAEDQAQDDQGEPGQEQSEGQEQQGNGKPRRPRAERQSQAAGRTARSSSSGEQNGGSGNGRQRVARAGTAASSRASGSASGSGSSGSRNGGAKPASRNSGSSAARPARSKASAASGTARSRAAQAAGRGSRGGGNS